MLIEQQKHNNHTLNLEHSADKKIKRRIIVVAADFGMGGISKSAIEWLDLVDYNKYDITLYIRRNDALELLSFVNKNVNIITVDSELKKGIYDNSFTGQLIKIICELLKKINRKYLAKQLYRWYKYPKQRIIEGDKLKKQDIHYDTAIAYSTADDIPLFVSEQINADKKYLFIHQSTAFSKKNQKTLPKFDGVVAVSNNLCQKLKKEFPNRNINFLSLPNYVSFNRTNKAAKEFEVNQHENKLHLATCGRLVDVKGYDILLETAEKLKSQNLNFIWNWIGDGDCRKKMEEGIKEKLLENEVYILGEKINPYPYIASCDIYIQPSKAEAFSLTIYEALTLGKMVISTKTIGGGDILTKFDCGTLVNYSSDELSECILELSKNKPLLEHETNKVKTINWSKEETEYTKTWDKLLSGKL